LLSHWLMAKAPMLSKTSQSPMSMSAIVWPKQIWNRRIPDSLTVAVFTLNSFLTDLTNFVYEFQIVKKCYTQSSFLYNFRCAICYLDTIKSLTRTDKARHIGNTSTDNLSTVSGFSSVRKKSITIFP
jgi:hypothetical protein